jgi:hypothetical protein
MTHDLLPKAQALVDRKYVARADERQKSMGLAYVEAERQDLAKEIAMFATDHAATLEAQLADANRRLNALRCAIRIGDGQ